MALHWKSVEIMASSTSVFGMMIAMSSLLVVYCLPLMLTCAFPCRQKRMSVKSMR